MPAPPPQLTTSRAAIDRVTVLPSRAIRRVLIRKFLIRKVIKIDMGYYLKYVYEEIMGYFLFFSVDSVTIYHFMYKM
jgi:hypothetical protein